MSSAADATQLAFDDPVLVPPHDNNVFELLEVFVARIYPKLCGELLKSLNAAASLPTALRHVKRVRKAKDAVDVLVWPVHSEDTEELVEEEYAEGEGLIDKQTQDGSNASSTGRATTSMPPALAAALAQHPHELLTAYVPRYAPHTKEDMIAWSHHWPVGCHPPNRNLQAQRGMLEPSEAQLMKEYMAAVFELAQNRQSGNACIIVDPSSGTIVGKATDNSHKHPLHHAVMVAVETVATLQRSTWYSSAYSHGDECTAAAAGGAVCQNGSQTTHTGKKHAGADLPQRTAEDAKRHRVEENINNRDDADTIPEQPGDNISNQQADGGSIVEASGAQSDQDIAAERPYMCTGYDCYVLQEPCAMCAMALVHSRVRRVVFCRSDKHRGLLGGSGVRLHSKRSLNHHYAVFKLPLGVL